jgi:hypothetical protein
MNEKRTGSVYDKWNISVIICGQIFHNVNQVMVATKTLKWHVLRPTLQILKHHYTCIIIHAIYSIWTTNGYNFKLLCIVYYTRLLQHVSGLFLSYFVHFIFLIYIFNQNQRHPYRNKWYTFPFSLFFYFTPTSIRQSLYPSPPKKKYIQKIKPLIS